ncbi:MAG: MerR family transcriptional regulator [Elusimicrobiaceae bacterium]|nr:MerR family transcriptional regulator [Elusimicrobiaceae bacterium]
MDLQALSENDYFSIGDVSRICGVPEHSLRYWEKEFGLIRPVRKDSGHRRYTKRDITVVLEIKDLIYKGKMTLEGAKKFLRGGGVAAKNNTRAQSEETLKLLREIHKDICNLAKEC